MKFPHCTKNEVFQQGYFCKYHQILELPADLVTFTKEILDLKLHFLYSVF